jgi:hypothetical protein
LAELRAHWHRDRARVLKIILDEDVVEGKNLGFVKEEANVRATSSLTVGAASQMQDDGGGCNL